MPGKKRLKAMTSKRELDLVTAMSKSKKSKEIPTMLTNLYDSTGENDPEAAKKNRLLVLRMMHRYPEKELSGLIAAITKSNPATAAKIVKAYAETSMDELYGINSAGIGSASGAIKSSTSPAGGG